jgi:hypothetical protein
MKWLRKHASNIETDNISGKFRNKRFSLLLTKLNNLNRENISTIDLGGTNYFWNTVLKIHPVKLNLTLINKEKNQLKGYNGIVGDVSDLSFIKAKVYDLCFSNSVIEHLPTIELQKKMADEIKRIASFHFIQTPAFIFPIEPHFLFPLFHWLPVSFRIKLVQNFGLGWFEKLPEYSDASSLVNSIRIMKKKELKKMFPESFIICERLFLIPKSYIITNF